MKITKEDLAGYGRLKRLNLVNSITGIKPANLIGSISSDGYENLAIFSSVIHLGSNPPLIGFILRPSGEVKRDTYTNICKTSHYTINCIHSSFTEKSHYTSAKFPADVSEFKEVGLTPEYVDGFQAPFVKESRLKFGLKLKQEIPIDLNATSLIIGEVQSINVDDSVLSEEGYLDLQALDATGISGLNSYYAFTKLAEYPYARPHELPASITQAR